MSNVSSTPATDVLPTSLRNGDPSGRLVNYQPARVGKLASDVTLEGSLLNGAVQGAEAVRTVIGVARQLYEPQDLAFVALGGQRLYRGLHGRGPRRTGCGRPRGHFQRRRRHPEHRRQLSAAQGLDVCSRLLRQELLQHFRGNLGNWEPAVWTPEVIGYLGLFYTGTSASRQAGQELRRGWPRGATVGTS